MTTDDSINMLENLADPKSWSESDVSHDYQPEQKAYDNHETREDGLPPIVSGADFPKQYDLPRRRPLVENIVKRGELMALFAASKMGKSWFFQNMATCLAEGLPFLDSETVKSNVLIMDLELTKVDAMDRLWNIALAMGLKHPPKNLHLWSLKKHCYDLDLLTEILHSRLENSDPFDAIFLDPIYLFNVSEGFDENNAGCITKLMIELEKIVSKQEASLMVSHHYRKGSMGKESHYERASGSGAFARFPDVLTTLSEHQLPQHAIFEMTSRSQKSPLPFVIKTEPPVFSVAENADPTAHRKYGQDCARIEMTPDSLLELIPIGESITKAQWFSKARMQGVSENKFDHLLSMIRQSGMVKQTKDDGVILFERNAGL
jgi:hypothetical protein